MVNRQNFSTGHCVVVASPTPLSEIKTTIEQGGVMHTDIIKRVKAVYDHFFKLLKIDPQTGLLPNGDKKFATYPYIGSKYGQLQTKLCIVGLDIGKDETPGYVQTFEERQQRIENRDHSKHNPHIAGTYMMALYFLHRELPEWKDYWERLDDQETCQQLLKRKNELPLENPLSYISLTNYHKFVTVGREHRTGGKDRGFINEELESQFLVDEIDALGSEFVVLQGEQFSTPYRKPLSRIALDNKLFIGPHPSGREKGCRKARALINRIAPW